MRFDQQDEKHARCRNNGGLPRPRHSRHPAQLRANGEKGRITISAEEVKDIGGCIGWLRLADLNHCALTWMDGGQIALGDFVGAQKKQPPDRQQHATLA